VTTAVQDCEQARIDGLLKSLRAAEAEYRQAYTRVLDVVAELDTERAGAITGFGTTARLVSGVLNLSSGEARVRVEHAELLTARRSLTGQELPPALPATAAELAAGAIGPGHLRVITATMRRIPPNTHPDTVADAEQTLAHMARRFDPPALSRIAERLLAHLDPDGTEPSEEPEQQRELRVRTGPDGTVRLAGTTTRSTPTITGRRTDNAFTANSHPGSTVRQHPDQRITPPLTFNRSNRKLRE